MKSRAAVHLVCISWRGSKWHRSVTGGQRGCWCGCGGHKGEAVSRGLFILVHISSPMACRGLLLSGERAEIAAPRTCTLPPSPPPPPSPPRSGLSQRHVHLQAQTATRTPPHALLPWRGIRVNGRLSPARRRRTPATGEAQGNSGVIERARRN